MHKQQSPARRFTRVVSLLGIAAAVALVSIPAAGTSSLGNGLFAYVRVNNPGPLPSCSGPDCTAANRVEYFVYVLNANPLTKWHVEAPTTRATLPDSFVVHSVGFRVFVNGVERPEFPATTFTPPPNPTPFRSWSGHWPATVTCPGPGMPCNAVGDPAVIPGENTAPVYGGWIHGDSEPNGTYVFKFVVHGTLNGSPVDLHASSRPIVMTD